MRSYFTKNTLVHVLYIAILGSILFSCSSFSVPAQIILREIPWMEEIGTIEDYVSLSVEDSSRADLLRTSKYLAPASDDPDLLPTVYQNVNLNRLHIEFMVNEFPDRFGGLTADEYMDLVYIPETRAYFAGALFQFRDMNNNIVYGFNIYASSDKPADPEEVKILYHRLSQSMKLRPFAYSPIMPANVEQARRWENPGFPIYLPEGLIEPEYEAYSPQTNYGRVRLLSLAQLDKALQNGSIGWQDIVVIDAAPTDIETVVAGIITGSRQGELSHINVRSIRRGTPNAYIQNPHVIFNTYQDELIKLTLTPDSYEITYPVEIEEAENWWDQHRPQLAALPQPDDEFTLLSSLPEMTESMTSKELIMRYGGKAAQLAILYSVFAVGIVEGTEIPYLVDGYAIPFHYYTEFMRSNQIPHPADSSLSITYEEYIHVLLEDQRFRSDAAYRRKCLNDFIEYACENGTINPILLNDITIKTIDVFGDASVKVRFRSSSNAEDDIEFNGAGLYDSTSVCLLDNLDNDEEGPSICDPDKKKERTIERGLKTVWMSLWNPKAFEEREYYQIGHQNARMGILVTRAFPAEDCNGVAFTGDPVSGSKDYYLINVQKGDDSVVQPGTGVIPEKDIIYIENGSVTGINRVRSSSLTADQEWVLSDAQLNELASVLTKIEQEMPVEDQEYRRDQIIFDIEFKYDNGRLVIKQIRPTLITSNEEPPLPSGKVTLSIPADACMVGIYKFATTLQEEYETLSMVHFISGDYSLPVQTGQYELEIVDQLEFGPNKTIAVSAAPGKLLVEEVKIPGERTVHRYQYEKTFHIVDQAERDLLFTMQGIQRNIDTQSNVHVTFDNQTIIHQLSTTGYLGGPQSETVINYSAVTDDLAQIYRHRLILEDGQSIELYELITRRIMMMGIAYADFTCADVKLKEAAFRQEDYWKLVYTAMGHCWNAKFRLIFDEPLGDIYGLDMLTTTLQWGLDTEAEAYWLDSNLNHMRKINILEYSRIEVEEIPEPTTDVTSWLFF